LASLVDVISLFLQKTLKMALCLKDLDLKRFEITKKSIVQNILDGCKTADGESYHITGNPTIDIMNLDLPTIYRNKLLKDVDNGVVSPQ